QSFEATLNEPGDDKWDGVFNITFWGEPQIEITAQGDISCLDGLYGRFAKGIWKSNNKKSTKDVLLVKSFEEYRTTAKVNVNKAYFHELPNVNFKKKAYVVDGQQLVVEAISEAFAKCSFENANGVRT